MKRISIVTALLLFLAAFVLAALASTSSPQISVSGTTTGNLVWIETLMVGQGGDARVRAIRTGSVSFNSASIGATSKLCTTVVAITGLANGDIAHVNPRAAFEDDIVTSEIRIDAAGADVELCLYNPTAGAIDPAAVTVDWLWFDLTG